MRNPNQGLCNVMQFGGYMILLGLGGIALIVTIMITIKGLFLFVPIFIAATWIIIMAEEIVEQDTFFPKRSFYNKVADRIELHTEIAMYKAKMCTTQCSYCQRKGKSCEGCGANI